MAIARRRESVLENERAELLAGPRRRERDRNEGRRIEEHKPREARKAEGEKEKEATPRRERGNEGRKGGEKGQGEDGQEDEGGTKYRRRTAVGIKRGDGRRCGGPTLFPVEDWTAPLPPLRRPSCPPTSSFLPSGCSFFSSSSPFKCACVRACVLLYRPTLYLTSSLTRVPRARARLASARR